MCIEESNNSHNRRTQSVLCAPWMKMASAVIIAVVVVTIIAVSLTSGSTYSAGKGNITPLSSADSDDTCMNNLFCLNPTDCQDHDLEFSYSCSDDKICCIPKISGKINVNISKSSKQMLLPENCGQSFVGNRIAGGKNASLGQFPWMALIGYIYPSVNITQYLCGGSLINDRYILTAAHCTKLKPFVLSFAKLGELNIKTDIDCELQGSENVCGDPPVDMKVEKIIVHPNYNSTTLRNDIALLRLAKNVSQYTEFIQPICLPFNMKAKENYLTSRRLEIAGWGKTASENLGGSTVLQFAVVNGITNANCSSKLPPKIRPISEKQICVTGTQIEEACRGDSGGPLMDHSTVDNEIRNYIVGIVSFKSLNTCGSEKTPGVFTKVDEYLDWILDTIQP